MADREVNFIIKTQHQEITKTKVALDDAALAAKKLAVEAKKLEKEQSTAANNLRKSTEALAKAEERRSKDTVEGLKKLGEGAVAFGRAIGLAGVATSQNMEAAIRLFAKFESGVQIFKGIADSVEGARKIWLAYTAVSKAAAAADVAAAAAAAARAKASAGAGVAGSAAGGAVAGAAGGGIGAYIAGMMGGAVAALKAIVVKIVAFLAPLVAIAAAVSAVLIGIISIFSKDFRTGLKLWITGHDELKEHQDKLAKSYQSALTTFDEYQEAEKRKAETNKAVRDWSDKREDLQMTAAGATPAQIAAAQKDRTQAPFNEAQAAFNQIDNQVRQSNGQDPAGHLIQLGQRATASDNLQAARKELEDSIKNAASEQTKAAQGAASKLLKIEQDKLAANEKALQSATEKANKEREGLEAVKQKVQQERDRLKSAQERFVDMNPQERAKLVAASKKAEQGQDLTKDERDLLRGDGLNQAEIDKDTANKVKGLNKDELAYFNRQNKVVADTEKEQADQQKKVNELEAAEKKLRAAVDSSAKTIETAEAAVKKLEEHAAGEPARVAELLLKIQAQSEARLLSEVNSRLSLEDGRKRANTNAAMGGK